MSECNFPNVPRVTRALGLITITIVMSSQTCLGSPRFVDETAFGRPPTTIRMNTQGGERIKFPVSEPNIRLPGMMVYHICAHMQLGEERTMHQGKMRDGDRSPREQLWGDVAPGGRGGGDRMDPRTYQMASTMVGIISASFRANLALWMSERRPVG